MSTQQYRNRSLNDLNMLGRSIRAVKEVFGNLENAAKEVGLNEDRTKFLLQTRKQKTRLGQNVTFDRYNFEVIKFMYLGSKVNRNNGESKSHKRSQRGHKEIILLLL